MENKLRGGATVKEGGRILATTFLSLLLPLSFILVARLAAARYFTSAAVDDHETSFSTSVFILSKTTLILSCLVTIGALIGALKSNNKPAFAMSKRRHLCVAWILISFMQVCLSLGIYGTTNSVPVSGFPVGNLVLPRRAVFVLGLHEATVFWRRSVVAPVVDEIVVGFYHEGCGWVEEGFLAVAFGNLWWKGVRDETEALAVADIAGWLLYYLTAAVGGVRVVNGLSWAVMRILGHCLWPKVEEAVNITV